MSAQCAGIRWIVMLAAICVWPSRPSCGQSSNQTSPPAVARSNDIRIVNLGGGVVMEFVRIRPGAFRMGSTKGFSNERPVHLVVIKDPFYLGKYKVTQEQWKAVMGNNPSNFQGARNPVDTVSWNDCTNFVAKLNEKLPGQTFRLPTEAEWEYACRAGNAGDYCYGDGESNLRAYAWYSKNSESTTHPVGGKKPNAWGLHDMHGNGLEWCQDVYHETYEGAPVEGSAWMEGSNAMNRVLRGGAWLYDAFSLRSAVRGKGAASVRDSYCGLRLALWWRVGGEMKLQL